MIRLIEDTDYFFFFATPQLAYIVEKKTLNPKAEENSKLTPRAGSDLSGLLRARGIP